MISPVKIWRRQKVVRERLGHKGKIISWTMIMVPPADFKDIAPYPVAIVELEDGNRAVGMLVDYQPDELKVGQTVVGILRKIRKPSDDGVIAYGLKFKPV